MAPDKKSLDLLVRFSLITNRLRFCGPKDAHLEFFKFLSGKRFSKQKIIDAIKRYEGLYIYLEHISKILRKNVFDYEVIEAYWLGNYLLESLSDENNRDVIGLLVNRGLPQVYADTLIKNLPPGLNLSHSFNVLYVGVGKVTESVPTNIKTINKCMISIGKILKIQESSILAEICPLAIHDGIIAYSSPEIQHIEYDTRILMPKVLDRVAVHWDYACKILTSNEENNLRKYTQQNIDALNRALFFSNDLAIQ